MKFAFVGRHYRTWSVALMCRVLGISRSGYYGWRQRGEPALQHALLERVRQIHLRVGRCYGSRRMARAMKAEGHAVGRYLARSLMRQAGIEVRRRRKYRLGRGTLKGYLLAPNHLSRQFSVTAPATPATWPVAPLRPGWSLRGLRVCGIAGSPWRGA